MVQGQDYKMDASKLPNQILSIFDKDEIWRCRNGRGRLSY